MKYLVTGSAGFIGYHLSHKLCTAGFDVVGVDNINNYYDSSLKLDRLYNLKKYENFLFKKIDVSNQDAVSQIFEEYQISHVIHLAAQAGVRYSLDNPRSYISSNIDGFLNILESCRHNEVEHLVYASSSSVYGLNQKYPFSSKDSTDHPASLYAATKKSNELMAHSYSHLYGIPTTGLRFFTVYGPWGRPDMALFLFTEAILKGKKIDVNNNGLMQRDFTYVDDIVEGIFKVQSKIPKLNSSPHESLKLDSSSAPYSIYNIGAGNPVKLTDFIEIIEDCLKIKAEINYKPMQPGDVESTHADVSELFEAVGYQPQFSIEQGIENFVTWYKDYYNYS